MKEFLKSFRRKLAFLLAVLLVLGNVNWEAMVRAEGPVAGNILNTSNISEYFYGEEIIIDLNEHKTDPNLMVSYDWKSPTPPEEDAVLTTEGSLTIKKAFSGTVTATAGNYAPQDITISVNQPTAALASEGEIGTLTYGENKVVTLACSTGSRLQDFIFTPSDAAAVDVQVNDEQVNTLKLNPLKATGDNITIGVKLKDAIKDYYTDANYSTTIDVGSIAKASFGEITVKNGDTTYVDNSNIEVTFGDSITLSCSESTNSAGTWECTSNDEGSYVLIGGQGTDESGNVATFPLTIVKASDSEDGELNPPITITVSKKNENYNEESTNFNITHIKKADQGGFEVYKVTGEGTEIELTAKTDTITFSDALCYQIVGAQEEGATYTYKSSNEDVAKSIAECPGKFQILKNGQVDLTVTKSKTNYNDKSERINLTVSPSNADFVSNFGIEGISDGKVTARDAIEKTGGYQLSATGVDVSIVGYTVKNEDGTATDSASITTDGLLTITAAGKYKITATAKKAGYTDQLLTYVLEVYREDQEVSFDPNTINQVMFEDSDASDPQYITLKASATEEGTVTYSITNADPAGVIVTSAESDKCKIKITKEGTITVKASVPAGKKYNAADKEITIKVTPNNKPLFTDIEVEGATVNETGKSISYTTSSVKVQPTGALESKTGITYKYYVKDKDNETNDVAEIVEATGVLTLKKAGPVTITVVASLDNYVDTTKTYVLEVTRAPQSLSFTTLQPEDIIYGTQDYTNIATVNAEGCLDSNHAKIKYEIVEGSVIADIDEDTGTLTFKDQKTGTVKVKATKSECDQYAECTAEYSVTVKNLSAPENPYTLEGTIDPASSWYRSNVTIKPCADYQISDTNSFEETNWKDSLVIDTQGLTSGKKIYLRNNATKQITDAITVVDFKIDTVQPTANEIKYSTSVSEKVVEGITLGFFKNMVEVTLVAQDRGADGSTNPTGSGIAKFEWWTIDESGTENTEKNTIQGNDIRFADGTYTCTLTINERFRNKVCFTAYDAAGNEASSSIEGDKLIVLENDKPELSEEYSGTNKKAEDTENRVLYYDNSAELYLTLKEENFYPEDDMTYLVQKDGAEYDKSKQTKAEWIRNGDTNEYKKTITLPGEGHYIVSLKYNDPAENGTTDDSPYAIDFTSNKIVVDQTAPSRKVDYTTPKQVVNDAYVTQDSYDLSVENQGYTLFYDNQAIVTIKITERNFDKDKVTITVKKNGVESAKKGSAPEFTWIDDEVNHTHTTTVTLDEDGTYEVKVSGKDLAEREMPPFVSEKIIVDKQAPTLQVSFPKDIVNKYGKDATDTRLYKVSETAFSEDIVATITISVAHFRASDVEFAFTNTTDAGLKVPGTEKTYSEYFKDSTKWVNTIGTNDYILTVPFQKDLEKTYEFTLNYKGLSLISAEEAKGTLVVDNIKPKGTDITTYTSDTITEGSRVGYVYSGETTVTFQIEETNFISGDVKFYVNKDGVESEVTSENVGAWKSNAEGYTCDILVGRGNVDGDYQIRMSYTDRSNNKMVDCYSKYIIIDTKKPVVKLDYAANDPDVLNSSFYGSNRTATLTVQDRTIVETEKLSWTFTALNMLGQTVTIPEENITDWALDTKTHTWTRVVKLSVDAIYSFSLNGTDALGNTSDTPIMQNYTMDTTAPVDLKIDYSEGGNWVNNVLGAISFGYYKTPITVTLTAKDITSPIDYFDWTYTKRAESNNTPATAGERITSFTQSGDTATATFTLTPEQAAQYCGNITFTVTNKAGHQSTVKADENRVIVADTITPTRVVEFTPATQVINKTSRQTVETYDPNSKQDLILFYDKPMTITLKVTEANFYPQDAVVTVNDAATDLTWTQNGDEYTTTVTFSTDGDYVFKMTYADRSGNVMETYESSQITIDTVSPTISVDIVGSSSTGEYDGTKYYSTNTSAIITIVEHNFRATDVTGSIVALSSAEQGVGIQDFAAFLSNEANWVTEGDTHIASYPMTTDATYNFQVEYTDLAKHSVSAATGKYCVDKEAPTNVSLTYSTPVVETLLEAISFKFYNAQATVSVAAIDETAGVNKIVYSLLKADGASDTNLELLEQTITEETFTYSNGRREATAQFKLPASELRAGTQFNGTIKLIVYDRAMNNVAYENNERVIIDNIAPQLDIQYNDSTNERDNILYYGEEIRATLHMNEANFYRDDVKVTVSRNNGGFEPITVNWSDTNADVHIGNFTLSEDGDYVVMVEYTDKSTNQMVSYTSEQMTIDTDMPVVTISGVENRKPYASGTVGFTVSVSDTNLDSDSFAPQFSAWVKEGNTIVQKDMFELGSVTVGNDKDSCTYVVDNLPEDGIYTISTSVMDMVGHTVDSMHMDNENGTENDFVRFSVNRNGSTYYIDDATTLGMLGSFVPYDKAGNVVVREVNPTALNDVTVTMFKDEKTIALEENSNFAFNLQHNEGEWYEYSYTIYRTNFEEDGIYSILLHSRDEAEHVAENTLEEKNVTISFAIDSTNPVLIISNLEDGATYNANSYTVYMQASDNLKLSEAVVSVDDKKVGSWTEAEQTLSDDDTYEFTINENNRAQKVSVSLVDKAGNRTTQDYSVTVTTNAFIRVINNKPLLFGIVGGATGAVVVPTAGIALFGKKKLFFVLLNKLKGVFIR